jgi:hypothetical protein
MPGTISNAIPGFLGSATEDQRIARLQPHHYVSGARAFEHQGVDTITDLSAPVPMTNGEQFGAGWNE